MRKKTISNISRLDALGWKAKEMGISYGQLSISTTLEEQDKIYYEYVELINRKRERERQWVEAYNIAQKHKKNKAIKSK